MLQWHELTSECSWYRFLLSSAVAALWGSSRRAFAISECECGVYFHGCYGNHCICDGNDRCCQASEESAIFITSQHPSDSLTCGHTRARTRSLHVLHASWFWSNCPANLEGQWRPVAVIQNIHTFCVMIMLWTLVLCLTLEACFSQKALTELQM